MPEWQESTHSDIELHLVNGETVCMKKCSTSAMVQFMNSLEGRPQTERFITFESTGYTINLSNVTHFIITPSKGF